MENNSIRQIVSVIFKAVTLPWVLPLWFCPAWAVWNRKPVSRCLASALPARVRLCGRNSDEYCCRAGILPMQAYELSQTW